jgi:VRR-NUC domain-containing protein
MTSRPSSSRAPRLSEKQFQEQVLQLAKWCGWWAFHPYDSRRSEPGWPDLALLRPPELLLVELKSEQGKLTDEQATVLDLLQRCGLYARVWRPTDWEEIERKLARRR